MGTSGTRAVILSGGLCIVMAAAPGCASDPSPPGFGSAGAVATRATALGVFPASASMKQRYGIVQWQTYVGKNQVVATGYRTDGTAARGMQVAWFPTTPTAVGHMRLMMLDGTHAVLRRMVGGSQTGHLSSEQITFMQTMRWDLQRAKASGTGTVKGASAHGGTIRLLDDSSGPAYGTSPGTGPDCAAAWSDPSITQDRFGCASGAADFETVVGVVGPVASCAQLGQEMGQAKATCDTENQLHCDASTPPNCDFTPVSQPVNGPIPAPSCDTSCQCAKYGAVTGDPSCRTCVDNSGCDSGQECHWGSCGPAPAKNDNPSEGDVSQQNPSAPSCAGSDVSADPSTGQVGCTGSSNGGGSSSGSSSGGASSSGGSPDPTGGDPTGGDPAGAGSSSGGGVGGGSSSGGSACGSDGSSCAQDADCCAGACTSGTCGVTSTGGGTCAADGASCSQDADCCGGTCDTSTGTCGAPSGSSSSGGGSGSSSGGSCSPDGSGCTQDADCCSGTCDTSTGTCGVPSGSGSSGGGSGSGSGGGSCGNPGDACSVDTDCCSGSCDTASGTCL